MPELPWLGVQLPEPLRVWPLTPPGHILLVRAQGSGAQLVLVTQGRLVTQQLMTPETHTALSALEDPSPHSRSTGHHGHTAGGSDSGELPPRGPRPGRGGGGRVYFGVRAPFACCQQCVPFTPKVPRLDKRRKVTLPTHPPPQNCLCARADIWASVSSSIKGG